MHEVLAAQVSHARRHLQSEFEQLQDGDLNLVVQNVTPTQQTQSTNQATPQLKINQVNRYSLHVPVPKQKINRSFTADRLAPYKAGSRAGFRRPPDSCRSD